MKFFIVGKFEHLFEEIRRNTILLSMPRICKKIIVGLTGGIASGKTTALTEFKKKGFYTFNCDDIAKKIFYRKDIFHKIKKIFKTTNRNEIAKVVFSNAKKRKKLESILHPSIIKELKRLLNRCRSRFIVVEVPLLFEKNLKKLFNIIVVIWTSKKEQIRRLQNLGLSRNEALRRIKSQISLAQKKKLADRVIVNNRDIRYLKSQVKELIKELERSKI